MAAAKSTTNSNPLVEVQERLRALDASFKTWLAKQSLPVEAAIVTFTSAAQGAIMGAFMGSLTSDASSASPGIVPPPSAQSNPDVTAAFQQSQSLAGGPIVQARNFAVMTGVNAGISCAMKRIRGVEDVQGSMVAAFGSGAMFSLVSGMGGSNPALGAVTSGLFFALIQGGLFQVGKKFSSKPSEDVYYSRTTSMLTSLGLESYTKNFKKGMLSDTTLPLLTDSALSEVRIPPGPRLIILDHIQRDPELRKARK